MNLRNWFRLYPAYPTITRSRRGSAKQKRRCRPGVEKLEDRTVPTGVFPNDPGFAQQWELHNTG